MVSISYEARVDINRRGYVDITAGRRARVNVSRPDSCRENDAWVSKKKRADCGESHCFWCVMFCSELMSGWGLELEWGERVWFLRSGE